jgi:hypothetical protein
MRGVQATLEGKSDSMPRENEKFIDDRIGKTREYACASQVEGKFYIPIT